ncbi:hypothetical protein [Nocardioides nanhaiensis]|uniref:Uncharacterized protein n=1 Tax=Nocardioides nanhaiensis TaxID=1476871 RepID=A0ABP8WU96_9ACTN
MVFLVVSMLFILVVCGVIAVYVAYPARGEQTPGAPWLGEALGRAAQRFQTLDETHADPREEQERVDA